MSALLTTPIQWHDPLKEMPDTDTTVLVGFVEGEVELGWFDSEHDCWRSAADAMRFNEDVSAWAHLPEVPAFI